MTAIGDDTFETSPAYRTALQQLDAIAKRLALDPGVHERLRYPRRALVVSVPTLMDDGRTEVFLGYRVPKGAKTTNWAAPRLSAQQITYAATDAWVCRELYLKFEALGLL